MSKLYVSCIVVALLALAVMPAIAETLVDGATKTVTVTATVPEYINMDAEDLSIAFGTLTMPNTGYVESEDGAGDVTPPEDTAKYTISTNVPIRATYENGSDLANGTYEMELQFSVRAWGWIDWLGGTAYVEETGAGYSGWGGCGIGAANDPSGLTEQAASTVGIQACQAFTAETRARLYQNGINDPAGSYSQADPLLLTLHVP